MIPTLAPGSGFLALDLDSDGRVTDGRELFGPTTGQGFTELAARDADGNGWIDGADAVYGRLRVWTRGAQQEPLGRVKASGLYPSQDGAAGVVQELDLFT